MSYVAHVNEETGTISFPLDAYGQMDPHLVSTLRSSNLSCFLPYEVKNDGEQPTDIEIDTQGLGSLSCLLRDPVNAAGLVALFRHLHNLIEACAYHGLPFMNVVLHADYIYTASLEEGLAFAYLPVTGKVRGIAQVHESFTELQALLRPQDAAAEELLQGFSEALDANDPLNLMVFSDALGDLAKTELLDDAAEAEPPSSDEDEHQGLELFSGPERETVSEPEAEPEPEPEAEPEPEPEPVEEPWAFGRHVREDPGTSVLNAVDITELMAAEAARANIAEEEEAHAGNEAHEAEQPARSVPDRYRLVHKRSGNAADIHGNEFTVGKSKHAHFQVLNTTTVSRIHALFSCTNEACSLKDNHSLNGTFVNDRRLDPDEEVLLCSGDVIRMSDEEFSFEVISYGSVGVIS